MMLNTSRQFPHMSAVADYVEAEAASIRSRVGRASPAAYERVAKLIRANLGNNDPVGLREQLQASVSEVA